MFRHMQRINLWALFLTGLVASVAVFAQTGYAGDPGTSGKEAASVQNAQTTQAQAPSGEAAGQAGLRAFIDPETRKLREPTAEEESSLHRLHMKGRAFPMAPRVVYHPNGMVSAELTEEYMNDVIARKNPDGTVSWVCVPRSLSENVLKPSAPLTSPELEKE